MFSNCYAAEGLAKDSNVEEHCLCCGKSYLPIYKSHLKDGVSPSFRVQERRKAKPNTSDRREEEEEEPKEVCI